MESHICTSFVEKTKVDLKTINLVEELSGFVIGGGNSIPSYCMVS